MPTIHHSNRLQKAQGRDFFTKPLPLTVGFLVHKIVLWKIFLDKLYIFEKLYAIIKL